MQTIAAIIKHPYRNDDYRIDIYEVPDEFCDRSDYIKAYIESQLLGHFEVVSLTSRIQQDCKFGGSNDDLIKYENWLKKQNEENKKEVS